MSFLPGMFPGAAAISALAAGLTTLTQVASGTSIAANGAITASAAIQAGDLIVVAGFGQGVTSGNLPPGFTQATSSYNNTTAKGGIYYKIATGGDAGTSVTGFSGSGGGAAARNTLYVFRGNIPITGVTVGDPATSGPINANPAAQVVNASGGTAPLVVLGKYEGAVVTDINPRTMTPAKDGEIESSSTNAIVWLAYKIYNSSPADVTVDMDDEGFALALDSCYLQCS